MATYGSEDAPLDSIDTRVPGSATTWFVKVGGTVRTQGYFNDLGDFQEYENPIYFTSGFGLSINFDGGESIVSGTISKEGTIYIYHRVL